VTGVQTCALPIWAAVDIRAGVFVLANAKGGRVIVPAEKIAYLELGANEQRRVGFSSR